jgi:hypothetical protein
MSSAGDGRISWFGILTIERGMHAWFKRYSINARE